MKVGILTYHDTNNFGAQLQAASVQRFLASEGVNAELVDFRPYRHEIRRNMTLLRAFRRLDFTGMKRELESNKRFRNSIFSMAEVSNRSAFFASQVPALCQAYDALVCGSDELWNFGNYRGYMAPYILDFAGRPGALKISYAASIGSYKPSPDMRARMKKALLDFSTILVRDPTTLAFVGELGLDAKRVVDPTFLADLGPIKPPISDYVMLSGAMKAQQVAQALEAARSLGLRVVTVGVRYPGHEGLYVPATPREWIGYVKQARYHITSLFHGAALSLKYETRFCVFRTLGKEQKILSLLEWMGEPSRSVSPEAGAHEIVRVVASDLSANLGSTRDGRIAESRQLFLSALRGNG